MRSLLFVLLLAVIQPTHADVAPQRVVATGWSLGGERLVLTIEDCGWGNGARRAYHTKSDWMFSTGQPMSWGCWGFNEQGVQILWDTGRSIHVDYLNLWAPGQYMPRQMGYQSMYRRVWQLTQGQ